MLTATAGMRSLILCAAAVQAAEPSTADLAFMIGEWRLEGAFNPGTPQELREVGRQTCAMTMGGAYVRCDVENRSERGRVRQQVVYYNYNPLYKRFESLFISSNWPTKVIGSGALERHGNRRVLRSEIQFTLPDGRTEHVRDVRTFEGNRFEAVEELRVAGENWKPNYRLRGDRLPAATHR